MTDLSGPTQPQDVTLDTVRDEARRQARRWAPYELWPWLGDSNAVGQDAGGPPDLEGLDAPDFRAGQVSLGRPREGQSVLTPGELILLQDPAQDDTIGGGVGPKLAFCKRRLEHYPGIRQLVILPAAVGGAALGTPGGWSRGDGLWSQSVDDANGFLLRNPRFRVPGLFVSLGQRDAASMDVVAFRAAFEDAVDGWRTSITGAARSHLVAPTLPDDFLASSANGRQIERYLRLLPQVLARASVVDMAGQPTHDGMHFTAAAYRVMGAGAADAARDAVDLGSGPAKAPSLPTFHLRHDAELQRFADPVAPVAAVAGGLYRRDPLGERGVVLDCAGRGYDTTAQLNGEAYTVACWVQPRSAAGRRNLVAFRAPGEVVGQVLSLEAILHEDFTGVPAGFEALAGGPLPLDAWSHVALAVEGDVGRVYLNGAPRGVVPPASIPALVGRRPVRVGAWDALGDNPFDGLLDEIVLAPRRLSDAEIAALARR